MSGALAAGSALVERVQAGNAAVKASVDAYGNALRSLRGASDLMDQMQATAALILAAEALEDAASDVAKKARAALAETMMETGGTQFRTETHTVSAATKPARVVVTDTAAIPITLMRQPPPAPDLHAIHKLLSEGKQVPGTQLIDNGEPVLRFLAKKVK